MTRLPILMYHNVTTDESKSSGLTISTQKLEQQLQYITNQNFTSLFVSELENVTKIPLNSIVITFDDVTKNQLNYALPLLKKYNIKATFFVPFFYVGKTDLWNKGDAAFGEEIMTVNQLKSLESEVIELGQHSFFHTKYTEMSDTEIQLDFDESYKFISANKLKVYEALAFPYGNYPRKQIQKEQFTQLLIKNNIKMAFRIGNRVNLFPFKNKYEIQRIDMKGNDSMFYFKWKLRFGKLRLF